MGDDRIIEVPFRCVPGAEVNRCFANVVRLVRESGGRARYGWVVTETELWVQHAHHAVWETPDGRLLEVTPLVVRWDGGHVFAVGARVRFLPDDSALPTGGTPPCLPHCYFPKGDDPRLVRACEFLTRSDRAFSSGDWEGGRYWTARAETEANRYAAPLRFSIPPLPRELVEAASPGEAA